MIGLTFLGLLAFAAFFLWLIGFDIEFVQCDDFN